ncbi:hypothetical protein BGX27_010611 [Mortierella sp. AM989]|nr:hypothetical protein BGX27_010611 [Mortierella sp. AM989]
MEPEEPNPDLFDILLTDVSDEDVRGEISTLLNTDYLSPEDGSPPNIIHGILWGRSRRPFVSLRIQRVDGVEIRNIHFLVDTGALSTYVCGEALRTLGVDTNELRGRDVYVRLNNVTVPVFMSPMNGHFSNINLLGANFLAASFAQFNLNYQSMTVTLELRFA